MKFLNKFTGLIIVMFLCMSPIARAGTGHSPNEGNPAANDQGDLMPDSKGTIEPPDTTAVVKRLILQIKKPTTHIEMLKNLQFVFSHRLLKEDGLYTSENLERIFGGTNEDWAWVDKTEWVTAENYAKHIPNTCSGCYRSSNGPFDWVQSVKGTWHGSSTVDHVQFEFSRLRRGRGGAAGFDASNISVKFLNDSGIDYEGAKEIFIGDQTPKTTPLPDSPKPQADTHVHANEYVSIPKKYLDGLPLAGALVFSDKAILSSVSLGQDYR